MAKEIKDIQQLIVKRAESKLDKELADLVKVLHTSLGGEILLLGDGVKLTVGEKTESLRSALWSNDRGIFVLIKERLLPKRIEQESKDFLSKVDSIRQDVDNLMGVQSEADDLPY